MFHLTGPSHLILLILWNQCMSRWSEYSLFHCPTPHISRVCIILVVFLGTFFFDNKTSDGLNCSLSFYFKNLVMSFQILWYRVSCRQDQIPESVLVATVRERDNITLCCDCKLSTGANVLLLQRKRNPQEAAEEPSECYGPLIKDASDDEPNRWTTEDKQYIAHRYIYSHGSFVECVLPDPWGGRWNCRAELSIYKAIHIATLTSDHELMGRAQRNVEYEWLK